MTSGLGQVSATPLHRDTECSGQPMFEGIPPYGPHDWKYWGKGNNWATFGFIWHFSKECHPTGWVWPVTESYFDVRGFPAMTEHCIPQTMMRNSFVWGYLAGRE